MPHPKEFSKSKGEDIVDSNRERRLSEDFAHLRKAMTNPKVWNANTNVKGSTMHESFYKVTGFFKELAKRSEDFGALTREEVLASRYERRLAKRDSVILAKEKRIKELEAALANRTYVVDDVYSAVQKALCNVRMIPVHGLLAEDKVVTVEVKSTKGG